MCLCAGFSHIYRTARLRTNLISYFDVFSDTLWYNFHGICTCCTSNAWCMVLNREYACWYDGLTPLHSCPVCSALIAQKYWRKFLFPVRTSTVTLCFCFLYQLYITWALSKSKETGHITLATTLEIYKQFSIVRKIMWCDNSAVCLRNMVVHDRNC